MIDDSSPKQQPVTSLARQDFALLQESMSVGQALEFLRRHGVGERIVYFYVAAENGRLAGVIPTRRLLTAAPEQPLRDIMIARVVSIPDHATAQQACEQLVMHRFLALPVVDRDGRIVGVVDVDQFTDEVFDLAAREQADAVFEALGFRLDQVRVASPLRAFRLRFPWLLATIAGGTVCALLLGASEATLAKSLVLAFFLALVLGLGESVAVQSMTVTIQALRARAAPRASYLRALQRELLTATLLGLSCGAVVGLIAYAWKEAARPAAAIGLGIAGALLAACAIGLTVPWAFHARKLDLKIAVGPIVLACADVCTVAIYLWAATLL